MGAIAETCSLVGAHDVATECYELLSPFADRCIVLGDGYVLWCSVEKSLGLLALTIGRADDACRHLERALSVHLELRRSASSRCERVSSLRVHFTLRVPSHTL